MSKGMLRPEDLLLVDPEGRKLAGTREVSTELSMHLLIYQLRDDVNAVVHAHPPTATGFAAAGLARHIRLQRAKPRDELPVVLEPAEEPDLEVEP